MIRVMLTAVALAVSGAALAKIPAQRSKPLVVVDDTQGVRTV